MSRDGGSYFVCVACDRGGGGGLLAAAAAALAADAIALSSSSAAAGGPSQTSFQCIKCQESFSCEHDVRVHVATHVLHEGNVHECRLCSPNGSVSFDSPARLQAHLVAEHELVASTAGGESVAAACEVCGRPIGGPTAARAHALEHGQLAWRHACQRCPLRFFFAAELRNHELVEGHGGGGGSGGGEQRTGSGGCPSASPRSVNSGSSSHQQQQQQQFSSTIDDLRCPDCSRYFVAIDCFATATRLRWQRRAAKLL